MSDADLRPSADGEIQDGLTLNWPGKPKKRPPSRLRGLWRKLAFILIIGIPIAMLTLFITVGILASLGYVNLDEIPVYRSWCLASLGQPRLAYFSGGSPLMLSVGGSSPNQPNAGAGQSNPGTTALPTNATIPGIYVTDSAVSRNCLLANVNSLVTNVMWSPDGSQVVYASNSGSQNSGLYIVNVADQQQKLLTSGSLPNLAAWTPDGKQIVYLTRETMGDVIRAINADGTNAHLVAQENAEAAVISPDGRYVAYNRQDYNRDGTIAQQGIGVVALDGSQARYLVSGQAYFPSWSPDGKVLAYTQNHAIYLINSDGSNPRLVIMDESKGSALWMPDGKSLVFAESASRIVMVNIDGSNYRTVSGGVQNESMLAAAPDGKTLAVRTFDSTNGGATQIFVLNADGSGLRTVTSIPGGYFGLAWSSNNLR